MRSQDIIAACTTLQGLWRKRNTKIRKWYKLIEMVDELEQKDMESFVGNDPRAAFNLLLGMLSQKIPHRIPPEELTLEQVAPALELSKTYDIAWTDIYDRYRRRGKYFLRDLIGLLLATGWYSVFATVSTDGSRCISEIWNPITVYPNWDDELTECAHIFSLTPTQANRMIARNAWGIAPLKGSGKIIIYDYWKLEGNNQVSNSIVLGKDLVKPTTPEPRFKRIPIFIAPIGGLPDTGDISQVAGKWQEEIGQASVATNENIYRYWNKWWSFSLQLLRDTAQARSYEKTRSGKQIVKPEDWNKRGAHFRMAPEDEVGFITPPAIPVELRSSQLDMEAMMQRGGPSWAMFGNIQQQLTAYVMSQIAASANQITKAYHQGIIDCISDIDNFWLDLIRNNNYKPYGRGLPEGLPDTFKVSADYEVKIPGDLIQRVTTARIMSPEFELSDEYIMEELFPEIKSPAQEQAKVRASKARKHPLYATIALIESFREEAKILRDVGDVDAATIYEKAADLAESTLEAAPAEEAPPARPTGPRPPGVRPEVVPPGGLAPAA